MRKTFTTTVLAAAAAMRAARRTHRTARALRQLSDAQLRDIGLTRFEIAHEVRRAAVEMLDC
jgi:uncharacterized protein YjiS (DUF1127 family)